MSFDEAAMRRAIACKRDGGALDADDWQALIEAYLAGVVDDVQMAALLMACAIRGLRADETSALTRAFVASGARVPEMPGTVDKHSSGGVGDSVSLVAVPWVAACGVPVAKLSGRALGHTGGTLDKLEAVPGVRTGITLARFRTILDSVGCAIAAQTAELVPADKRLYALRDRTSTVAEPGLIAASIVSKKIAGGAGAITYDIKTGAGAFMQEPEAAAALANTIVQATASFGRRALALVTDMDEPLGHAIGSGLETLEASAILQGAEREPRLLHASRTIADAMLRVSGVPAFANADVRARALDRALDSGEAYARFEALLVALGAREGALASLSPHASRSDVRAARSGFVARIDPVALGLAARALTDRFGPGAGVVTAVRTGDEVLRGDLLATIYGDVADDSQILGAFTYAESVSPARPFVYEEIASA